MKSLTMVLHQDFLRKWCTIVVTKSQTHCGTAGLRSFIVLCGGKERFLHQFGSQRDRRKVRQVLRAGRAALPDPVGCGGDPQVHPQGADGAESECVRLCARRWGYGGHPEAGRGREPVLQSLRSGHGGNADQHGKDPQGLTRRGRRPRVRRMAAAELPSAAFCGFAAWRMVTKKCVLYRRDFFAYNEGVAKNPIAKEHSR